MQILEQILDALVASNCRFSPSCVRMSRATYDRLNLQIKKLNPVAHINFVIQNKIYGLDIIVVPAMEGVQVE